jgi:hypothetical protein
MTLSDIQKDKIRYHLTNWNELKDKELIEELFDHYVIDIEKKIEEGKSFDEALKEVYLSFGTIVGLKKMQKQRRQEYRIMAYRLLKSTFYTYFQFPKIFVLGLVVTFSILMSNYSLENLYRTTILLHVILFILVTNQYGFYKKLRGVTKKIVNYTALLYIVGGISSLKYVENLKFSSITISLMYLFVLLGYVIVFETLYKYFKNKKLHKTI